MKVRVEQTSMVELSRSAEQLVRAWQSLPLNERTLILRKTELLALLHCEPALRDGEN